MGVGWELMRKRVVEEGEEKKEGKEKKRLVDWVGKAWKRGEVWLGWGRWGA